MLKHNRGQNSKKQKQTLIKPRLQRVILPELIKEDLYDDFKQMADCGSQSGNTDSHTFDKEQKDSFQTL